MPITIQYQCRSCGSTNIKKNGFNVNGNQQYYCKDCKSYKVLKPKWDYTEERQAEIIRAYHERASMRGVSRVFRISPATLARWLKKQAQTSKLRQTLTYPNEGDVLEVDEMWSYVGKKRIKSSYG